LRSYLASTAHASPVVEFIESRDAYTLLGGEIEDLSVLCGAPVTARTAWTTATLAALPDALPLGAVVRSATGALAGAAILVATPSLGPDAVTSPAGPEHRAAMVAIDSWAAELLATALASVLSTRPRGARLSLGAFHADDPVVAALARGIPDAVVMFTDPIPVVEKTGETDVRAYLSHGMRRSLRHARNRLAADGRCADIWVTGDPAEVLEHLPVLEVACRNRDHTQGRTSALDDHVGRTLWRRRCGEAVADGCAELAVLRIDGEPAAYVLSIVDGTDYRVLEGRLVNNFLRYSPGRLLEAEVLQRVLDDPTLQRLDWMTGVAPDKLLAANHRDRMVVVHAAIPSH
jgi:CelD/BcsL family acetyltransferase involved in cellulose biosynthesis